SPANCFDAAFYASKIALECMTPVILLTDGFVANGSSAWKIPSLKDYPAINPPYVNESIDSTTWKPYLRNKENNVRYWAIPGMEGFQHRLGGLEKDYKTSAISTDAKNHHLMTETRQQKIENIADSIPELQVEGDVDADLLVVGWGGTYGHLHSAMEICKEEGKKVALAHFQYINPLPKNTAEVLQQYKKIVVVEQNMGQFAGYLKMKINNINIEQYNRVEGQPFNAKELAEVFTKLLEE
ncbi:MAG: 2-oxoacid:acceptor oxidoreductase subunit alpha, partial [Paludibacteraceae bacterium]|nr:2-oxoacid:acceptor oxidoreductase subunit alpha [Paludibacteraceae bacterium]